MTLYPFLTAWFPPEPTFTDKDLPSLQDKVYSMPYIHLPSKSKLIIQVVTGAASRVGLSLSRLLYQAGGTVYVACRSASRCEEAIVTILDHTRNNPPAQNKKPAGELKRMVIDLSDLTTVKPAVETFLKEASRLDVLFNNAAVMMPPKGSKDKQDHDLEIGTICLAPYLLTSLLEPILIQTAALPDTPRLSVRVVFVVGLLQRVPPYELICDDDGVPLVLDVNPNYFQSKFGVTWLASRVAARLGEKGIMSTSVHPGLMATPLQRHLNPFVKLFWVRLVFSSPTQKRPDHGAYSEIFAGFHDIPESHNGAHLMAWGRLADMPDITARGLKRQEDGGTGRAQVFFDYVDREIKAYL